MTSWASIMPAKDAPAWERATHIDGPGFVEWLLKNVLPPQPNAYYPTLCRKLRRWRAEIDRPDFYSVSDVLTEYGGDWEVWDVPEELWRFERPTEDSKDAVALERSVELVLRHGWSLAQVAEVSGFDVEALR